MQCSKGSGASMPVHTLRGRKGNRVPAWRECWLLRTRRAGSPKTTSTVNLAAALAERGRRVLIVDLDPQSNLTMSQGFDPEKLEESMFDVLVQRMPIEQIIKHAEFDIAVASIELAGAELALASMIGRERALEKALLPVQGDYDEILIDTPPSLGLITVNALTASDGVIVPVQCEYLSLRGLVQLEPTLTTIRENLNPRVRIVGILPTMFDARLLHVREAVEILEENFGDLVFKTRIRKTMRYAEAPVKGQSVLRYDPRARRPRRTGRSPRRCSSVSKRRASMREGPLADLFRQTDGSQETSRRRQPSAAERPPRAAGARAAAAPSPRPRPAARPVGPSPSRQARAARPEAAPSAPARAGRDAAPARRARSRRSAARPATAPRPVPRLAARPRRGVAPTSRRSASSASAAPA